LKREEALKDAARHEDKELPTLLLVGASDGLLG